MADAAAVILPAIEKLDSWLLQKADHRKDCIKLWSLQSERKDLVVGMMEVWENDNEMLYNFLVRVEKVDNHKLYSFLGEVEDLWEVNCCGKLHSLLVQMLHPKTQREKVFSLAVETADLWKDSKGKLNKEKLYSWLAKKTELWEEDELFSLLEGMAFRSTGPNDEDELFRSGEGMTFLDEEDWKNVEGVRNDLRSILDFHNKLEDQGQLHYFMSDVVEIAQDVELLFHLKDSDPIILFLLIVPHMRMRISLVEAYTADFWGSMLKFFFEIKPIHKWLQEIEKHVRGMREELMGPSPTYSESDHHVVGLKEDVESLLRSEGTTICIRGLAGSGKTTLAREFYNHPEIVDGFEFRGWVCLSSSWKLSRKELLIELIRQFIDSSERDDIVIENMENKALRQILQQHLQDKPYVLVLDGVCEATYLLRYVFRTLPQGGKKTSLVESWQEGQWNCSIDCREPFFILTTTELADERSRLLFTTRSHEISCKHYEDCQHKVKNLDDDKSWQLLLKTTFFGSDDHEEFPKQLEKRGREMLMRKCNGLPLAINEVGKQWAEKRRSGSEWEEIVVEESLMNLELSETLVALESTYLNMNPEVKPCFLRLAFYKEGTIIRKKKFLQICTAGGLLEDQSQSGFDDLSEQTIIEEVDEYIGLAKTFRVNALFHRLSIMKAVDEIGFEILRKGGSNRASHEPCQHRVIHCSRDNKFKYNYSSTNQDEHLVSLFFHDGGGLSDICWKHFEQLKVLDMEGFGLKILPETVGDLIELKYLGLRNNYIQDLPQSLRSLKMIEVLDIAQNFMVEVPDILWEMDHLRHLYMSDIKCRKPLKIEELKFLETLTYISVDSWTYEVSGLKMMRFTLHKLGIEEVDENSNLNKLFASLAELDYLGCLILRGFRFRSMPSLDELGLLQNLKELKLEGRLTRLPSATNFPPKLWKLVLFNSCLDEDPIPILEKLPALRILILRNAYTGHKMVISNKGFQKLSCLVIREILNLRKIVKVGEGGMMFIGRLKINSCPYLETIPQELFWQLDHLQSQSLKCATP